MADEAPTPIHSAGNDERALTEDQKKTLLDDRRSIVDASFQIIKWLLATLFVLNGAAAIAVVSRTDIAPATASVIALHFTKGVLGAITAATVFLLCLLLSYLRVMWMLEPSRHRFMTGMMVAQIIALAGAAYGVVWSVDAFISGVELWAGMSLRAPLV